MKFEFHVSMFVRFLLYDATQGITIGKSFYVCNNIVEPVTCDSKITYHISLKIPMRHNIFILDLQSVREILL